MSKANDRQEGGNHYRRHGGENREQHWDRLVRLFGLPAARCYFIGNITKYAERYQDKNGVEDLRKARHYLDKLIEEEERHAAEQRPPAEEVRGCDECGEKDKPLKMFTMEHGGVYVLCEDHWHIAGPRCFLCGGGDRLTMRVVSDGTNGTRKMCNKCYTAAETEKARQDRYNAVAAYNADKARTVVKPEEAEDNRPDPPVYRTCTLCGGCGYAPSIGQPDNGTPCEACEGRGRLLVTD